MRSPFYYFVTTRDDIEGCFTLDNVKASLKGQEPQHSDYKIEDLEVTRAQYK